PGEHHEPGGLVHRDLPRLASGPAAPPPDQPELPHHELALPSPEVRGGAPPRELLGGAARRRHGPVSVLFRRLVRSDPPDQRRVGYRADPPDLSKPRRNDDEVGAHPERERDGNPAPPTAPSVKAAFR